MNTKDVLIAARKKIERPECWTKGAFARDAGGDVVMSTDKANAVCWCISGALAYCGGKGYATESAYDLMLHALRRKWVHLAHYNDDPATTHADVLALFDRAIAACKEE